MTEPGNGWPKMALAVAYGGGFVSQPADGLLDAASRGDTTAVRNLLAQGADANATTANGDTPLDLALAHLLTQQETDRELVEILADEGLRRREAIAKLLAQLRAWNKSWDDAFSQAQARGEDLAAFCGPFEAETERADELLTFLCERVPDDPEQSDPPEVLARCRRCRTPVTAVHRKPYCPGCFTHYPDGVQGQLQGLAEYRSIEQKLRGLDRELKQAYATYRNDLSAFLREVDRLVDRSVWKGGLAVVPEPAELEILDLVVEITDSRDRHADLIGELVRLQSRASRPLDAPSSQRSSPNRTRVIILKSGSRPWDEQWYIGQVLPTVGLPLDGFSGQVNIRYVSVGDLNHAYAAGLVSGAGYDPAACTITPFRDADGGQGLVIKVKN